MAHSSLPRLSDRIEATSHNPVLRTLWTVSTFGYRYPHKRRGENSMVCVFKTLVILFTRFSCLMGAIWYIITWTIYALQGQTRPFTIREQQVLQDSGTRTPSLSILSTERDMINATAMFYINRTSEQFLPWTSSNIASFDDNEGTRINIIPDEEFLVDGYQCRAYVMVVLKHKPMLSDYGWSQVTIIHPDRPDGAFTSRDKYNQYYFLPGHYVEIRFTPLQFSEDFRPDSNSSAWDRFKAAAGYGGKGVKGFAYTSSVEHMPFPEGFYDPLTTVIILRPQSNVYIVSDAVESLTFRDTLAKIGGLLNLVTTIIVFLFGASLLSPWGFIASLPYFRRRITGSLAKAYDTADGYSRGPFTTKFEETGKFEPDVQTTEKRVILLKERIDELEMVLSEFYLNGEVFRTYAEEREKLKVARAVTVAARRFTAGGPEGLSGLEAYQKQKQYQRESRQTLTSPSEWMDDHDNMPYQYQFQNHQMEHEHQQQQQLQGLLQPDHHSTQQSYIQEQQQQHQMTPSLPPRPPQDVTVTMNSIRPSESSLLSPSRTMSHAATKSMGGNQYEHLDMSDLSKIPREL